MGGDKNLLKETLEILQQYNKTPGDVVWVGDMTDAISWEAFAKRAEKITYDSGYGGAEINESLKIVGVDWWLERGEYDGSEWWDFKRYPEMPSGQQLIIKEYGAEI